MSPVALLVTFPLLLATIYLVAILPLRITLKFLRRRVAPSPLLPALLALGGYWIATEAAWMAVPRAWTLDFLSTVRASVDAVTYTHQVEHAAEQILLSVMLCGVAGAVAGFAAARWWRLRADAAGMAASA
jgi:hypothetical protein